MAWFTPKELPENKYYIFGKDGSGEKTWRRRMGVPLLAQIPLVQGICDSGDAGKPAATDADSMTGQAFINLAQAVVTRVNLRNKRLPKDEDNQGEEQLKPIAITVVCLVALFFSVVLCPTKYMKRGEKRNSPSVSISMPPPTSNRLTRKTSAQGAASAWGHSSPHGVLLRQEPADGKGDSGLPQRHTL